MNKIVVEKLCKGVERLANIILGLALTVLVLTGIILWQWLV